MRPTEAYHACIHFILLHFSKTDYIILGKPALLSGKKEIDELKSWEKTKIDSSSQENLKKKILNLEIMDFLGRFFSMHAFLNNFKKKKKA